MKSYEKNIWEDRIVQYPNRYKDQNDNLLTLTQEPGEVAQVGTLVEAEKMNNIEDGIEFLFKNRLFSYEKELLSSNWIKNDVTGFYEYDINDSNINSDVMVDGILDIENQCKLNFSYTNSYNGGFKVITTELPNEDINITFRYSLMNKVGEEN